MYNSLQFASGQWLPRKSQDACSFIKSWARCRPRRCSLLPCQTSVGTGWWSERRRHNKRWRSKSNKRKIVQTCRRLLFVCCLLKLQSAPCKMSFWTPAPPKSLSYRARWLTGCRNPAWRKWLGRRSLRRLWCRREHGAVSSPFLSSVWSGACFACSRGTFRLYRPRLDRCYCCWLKTFRFSWCQLLILDLNDDLVRLTFSK